MCSKAYGAVRAVDGLDLAIAPGEIVAVLGPNGAGKSTTTEMITGLTDPDAGRVAVFGRPPHRAVREGLVGVMLQAGALLHEATVNDVLRLMQGLHAHPLALEEVIERADLGSFLKTKTEKLSGGQAQRLRYALAIMADPQLLILDEPTVGMDVEIRRAFWASMREFIAGGRTVAVRHPLPGRGRRRGGPDRGPGPRSADRRRHPVHDQEPGRRSHHHPGRPGISLAELTALPAVIAAERSGGRLLLRTTDSDATLRALITGHPAAVDIEVVSASLEDAFLTLTHDQPGRVSSRGSLIVRSDAARPQSGHARSAHDRAT